MTTKLIKLNLKNFKSFKKAEIPISSGFTAIVGSNGSGKSNVLDALLFVLGITSLKALRAGKLTDLVYNNATENYAKVDLIIEGNDKRYTISRMIDKLGKSVYRLDEKRTTLNEINSLLVELGIDINGHNIVTQGDITKVVNMSSVERREIIDSIAGLSEFDAKKEEALKELNKVDQRIKEATIILNERNSFLEDLEKEMNAANEFKLLEKEKKQIKATVIHKELYSIEKRIMQINEELKTINSQKDESEKLLDILRKENSELKEKSIELGKIAMKSSEELYEKVGKELEQTKSKFNLEKELIDIKKINIEKNKNRIKNNKEEFEKSKNTQKETEKEIENLKKEQKKLEIELIEAKKRKTDIEKIAKEKNKEIIKIETEIDNANKDIENIRKENFDLEVFIKQWAKQKEFNNKKLNELLEEKNKIKTEIHNLIEKEKEMLKIGKKENLEKELNTVELKIENNTEKKSNLAGFIDQEKEAILLLKKDISTCPVCEKELETKRKNELIKVKENSISLKEKEILKIKIEIDRLRENKKEISENLYNVNQLLVEINAKLSLEIKEKEIDAKIKLIQQDLDEKLFEGKITKKRTIDTQLKTILEKRDLFKEKLHTLRKENIFEELEKISIKNDELIHNKTVIENKLNEKVIGINKINSKEESLLIENEELYKENQQIQKEIQEKEPQLKEIEAKIVDTEKKLSTQKIQNNKIIEEKEKTDNRLNKIDKELYSESAKLKKLEVRENEFNLEKSKLEVRENDLKEENKEFEGVEIQGEKNIDELKERLKVVDTKLNDIGAVNLKAIENFTELKKEVDEITEKAQKLENERLCVLDMIDKIDVKRTNVFMDCFNEVNKNFKDMFSKFFNGEGLLDLSNPNNPLESGLIIDAKPKGGKLQNIDSMSGGEKTLTALAFMFAIQLYSPAPFYAFDEADAALDKENSMKMGNLIEMIAKKSQFIAITHNDTITKKASQIIGVATNKDNSSVIGLKLKNNQ